MRARFEHFFKRRIRLVITILFFAVFTLVFMISQIFFAPEPNAKKMFWGTFLLSFGIIMFIFFVPKVKEETSFQEKAISRPASQSYQQLLDETEHCSQELKKQQRWAYGCLIMGWIVILIGRLSDHPPYNFPMFSLPVFFLTFLAAARSWEKENKLDVNIANCTIEGIKVEKKRPGLKSSYFHDLAKSYEGLGMWQFAFIRVSPSLMIIFSLLNSGLLSLLANHLSFPSWIIKCGAGIVLGAAGLFFARIACQPYYWLLERVKAIPA